MGGRLIHWRSMPDGLCVRKDNLEDRVVDDSREGGTITWTGEADFPGNVTCPTCRHHALYEDSKETT